MIVQRQPDQIATWFLVFFPEGLRPWHRYIPGRFKHVASFAYSAANRTWVVLDFHFTGVRVMLFPGEEVPDYIARWTAGSAILHMNVKEAARLWRPALYCVPAMAHLVGVGGAVLPDGLWRQCLRAGAKIIEYGQHQDDGPRDAGANTGSGA